MKKFLLNLSSIFSQKGKVKSSQCSRCTKQHTQFCPNSQYCYDTEDKPFFSVYPIENLELIKGTNVPVLDLVILAKNHYIKSNGCSGMCYAVGTALYKLVPNAAELKLSGYSHDDCFTIQPIPKFNHKIAIEKFGASNSNSYWWNINDMQSRISYFDWIIEEYSK